MDGAETVLRRGFQINARAGKGIFADVSEQIIKNAPKQIAVCHEQDGRLRDMRYDLQPCFSELFIVFTDRLLQKHANVTFLQIDLYIARRCLGDLDKIADELLEPLRLVIENIQIFRRLFGGGIFLFQEIYVLISWDTFVMSSVFMRSLLMRSSTASLM